MAKKFAALREKMTPAARARAQARTKAMLAEMALAELRKALDVSQEDVATVLKVSQANISKIENRTDPHVSTVAAYVEALGGELELIARFPDRPAGQDAVRLRLPKDEKRAA